MDIEDDEDDDCIVDLIPLVINTIGWTKVLGGYRPRAMNRGVSTTLRHFHVRGLPVQRCHRTGRAEMVVGMGVLLPRLSPD